jgi:hypothetical protein
MVKLLLISNQLSIFEARDLLLLDEQAFHNRTNGYNKSPLVNNDFEMIDGSHFAWLESLDIDGLLIVNLLIKNAYLIGNLKDRLTPNFYLNLNANEVIGETIRFEQSTCLNIDLSREKLICNVIAYFDLELNHNNLLKEARLKLLERICISIYNNTKHTLSWVRQQLKDTNKSSKFEAFQWFLNKLKDDSNEDPTEYVRDDNIEQLLSFFIFSSYISHSDEGFELEVRKIKSAWSSKKNRDSNNDKKACSYMLNIETIELLDELSKVNRKRKNEMLEILIEDACEDAGIIKKPARR